MNNNWQKKGVISIPNNKPEWIYSHSYVPTALHDQENSDSIRVYCAFRDAAGIGRIGFVDLDAAEPSKVLRISEKPSLDIGIPGTFDDNGVTPISVMRHQDKLYMYYAGWQLSDKVRYFLFSGLAISEDNGETFVRVSRSPILDRNDYELLVRTAPCVFFDGAKWFMIYSSGSHQISVNGKNVPTYSFKYIESNDGIEWPGSGIEVLVPQDGVEFGFGRPNIIFEDGIYKMWYSIRRFDEQYRLGYAESSDLKNWERKDYQLDDLNNNALEYENEMRAFATIVDTKYGRYMFYNGNDFGRAGICFAKCA